MAKSQSATLASGKKNTVETNSGKENRSPKLHNMRKLEDVTIGPLSLDRELWTNFQALPEKVRKAYLENVLSDTLKNLLYRDGDLLSYFMSKYGRGK